MENNSGRNAARRSRWDVKPAAEKEKPEMQYTIMYVPGKTAKVQSGEQLTVLGICEAAERIRPEVQWVRAAQSYQVRVNGKIFSNTENYPDSTFAGDINTTLVNDGATVLIMSKITGNDKFQPVVCTINGEEICLEDKAQIARVLYDHCGVRSMDEIESATANGSYIDRNYVVQDGDNIVFVKAATKKPFNQPVPVSRTTIALPEPDNDGMTIDGERLSDQQKAVEAVLKASFYEELDDDVIESIKAVLDGGNQKSALESVLNVSFDEELDGEVIELIQAVLDGDLSDPETKLSLISQINEF